MTWVSAWAKGEWAAGPHGRPPGCPGAGGGNRIVIEVDDLESVVGTMTLAGVQFRNEIVSGTGGKQVLAEDLDGNPIELFEPG